jgi:hypothetical protein
MHVPPTDTSTGSANLAQSFESCIRVDRTIAVESGVIVETMEEDEYRFGLELRKLTDREEEEATLMRNCRSESQLILPVCWVKNFFVSSSMQVSIISNSTLVKSLRVMDPVSKGLHASMNSSMGFVSLGIMTEPASLHAMRSGRSCQFLKCSVIIQR